MRRIVLMLLPGAFVLLAWSFGLARADPVVRRASISMPGWPAGAGPVRVALLSDIHLGNLATGPGRLRRIVDRVNALRPDLVVLAGDFIAGHERADARVAPGLAALGRLNAPLGVVAVLGNHEYWTDAPTTRRALERAGVTVLANDATRRGPVVVGGLDDMVTRHADLPATLAAMRRVGGARLLLSHSPDIAPGLPHGVPLLLAGHTHCGQVSVPLLGPPVEVSRYGARYRCGLVREGGRLTVVTAGTGTSTLPLRFGVSPDLWLLTLGP
jgi:hypothetical protein